MVELSFINPWLLPALALAVLPLLIHLHARASARRVDFPAAVLLLGSGEEITRLRRLRELLILAVRMMLVAAFVFCAARPVVKGVHRAVPARRALACAIVLDDSASMLARGPAGTRVACAKAVARTVVAYLEAGSELLVVTFSGRTFGPSPDLGEGLEWVESVEPTFLARGPEEALARVRAFCEGSTLPAEVHLLSDFEWLPSTLPRTPKSSGRGARSRDPRGGTAEASSLRSRSRLRVARYGGRRKVGGVGPELPGAALLLSVLSERDPDGAILGVSCPERRVYPGLPFSLEAEVRLEGGSPEVALELGGRQRTAPAEDARFRLVVDEPGVHVGKVTLRSNAPDAVGWDDSFHFVLNVCRPPRVACYGRDAEAVRRALRPGAEAGAPFLARPFVAEGASDCDCAFVTSPVPRETWSAVERAAVPAVVLGPALDGAAPCPSSLLPFGSAAGQKFEKPASLVLSTPVPRCLEIFLDGRNGELGSAAFALASVARPRGAEEGAYFSGGARPALFLWEEGAAFLGGISPPWSEFSAHPAFVPFVHELVAHACGLPAPFSFARPGEPLEPPASLRPRSVRLPGGASALLEETPAAADRPGPCVFFGDRGEWGAAVNCVEEIPGPVPSGEEIAALFRAREVHVSRGREKLLAAMARARAGVELRWLPFLVGGLFLLACALSALGRRRG